MSTVDKLAHEAGSPQETPSYASSITAPVVGRSISTETDEGKVEEEKPAAQDASSGAVAETSKVYATEQEREEAEREAKYLTGSK
jgi:hypothetical protein